jgi:hypothetical protein
VQGRATTVAPKSHAGPGREPEAQGLRVARPLTMTQRSVAPEAEFSAPAAPPLWHTGPLVSWREEAASGWVRLAVAGEAATRPGPSSCRGSIMIMLRCPRVLAPSLAQKAAMALRGVLWAAFKLAAVLPPRAT